MKISGFTMVRNVSKLYYPIKASIESILPIVDEFIVALGAGDEDDDTEQIINSIGSSKIKILHTEWDLKKYPNGTENAHQTDIAKEACSGDWLFYLQADEVVHEKYLDAIKRMCEKYQNDKEVEGFVFDYIHFWGDYDHHQDGHGWYPHEIRIIRNDPEIHSWQSAQSFRRIPGFDYKDYRTKEGTYKLKVARINAFIYHYGWVRPPAYMQNKRKALDTIHKGENWVKQKFEGQGEDFDYGPLRLSSKFTGSHPKVMKSWIDQFDWADKLHHNGPIPVNRRRFKHEKLKYRIISFIERYILFGRSMGEFKNYILIKK